MGANGTASVQATGRVMIPIDTWRRTLAELVLLRGWRATWKWLSVVVTAGVFAFGLLLGWLWAGVL